MSGIGGSRKIAQWAHRNRTFQVVSATAAALCPWRRRSHYALRRFETTSVNSGLIIEMGAGDGNYTLKVVRATAAMLYCSWKRRHWALAGRDNRSSRRNSSGGHWASIVSSGGWEVAKEGHVEVIHILRVVGATAASLVSL